MKTLILIGLILIFACNSTPDQNFTSDNNHVKEIENSESKEVHLDEICKPLHKKDIGFNVLFHKTSKNYQFKLKITLNNKSTDTVYFLNISCSEIEYLMSCKPVELTPIPKISCLINHFVVSYLKPNSQNTYIYNIYLPMKNYNPEIGLNFIEIEKADSWIEDPKIRILDWETNKTHIIYPTSPEIPYKHGN